jgi:L-asparagine transporter-like permease
VDEFQFRRTGFSAYFIYDSYAPIMAIIFCYIVLALSIYLTRYWKRAKRAERFFRATLAGFHEIAVMYFTITIVFEVLYFDGSKMKWVSIIICSIVNLYFLLYQLKVYYSLLDYPTTPINNPKF